MPEFHLPPYPKRLDSLDDLIDSATTAMFDQLDADLGEPVHSWFGLSYSNYLVLARALLQSMPSDWQTRFVRCLRELEEVASNAGIDTASSYTVSARTGDGKFVADPVPHYNRGRTQLDLTPRERVDA